MSKQSRVEVERGRRVGPGVEVRDIRIPLSTTHPDIPAWVGGKAPDCLLIVYLYITAAAALHTSSGCLLRVHLVTAATAALHSSPDCLPIVHPYTAPTATLHAFPECLLVLQLCTTTATTMRHSEVELERERVARPWSAASSVCWC